MAFFQHLWFKEIKLEEKSQKSDHSALFSTLTYLPSGLFVLFCQPGNPVIGNESWRECFKKNAAEIKFPTTRPTLTVTSQSLPILLTSSMTGRATEERSRCQKRETSVEASSSTRSNLLDASVPPPPRCLCSPSSSSMETSMNGGGRETGGRAGGGGDGEDDIAKEERVRPQS